MLHKNPQLQAAYAILDTSSTSVTNSAYVTLLTAANHTKPSTDVIVYNGGSQPIGLATGGAGSEIDTGAVILPGISTTIPLELASGTRLSVKALGSTTQSAGFIVATFLG
jgi:hypothetical protein